MIVKGLSESLMEKKKEDEEVKNEEVVLGKMVHKVNAV